MDDITDGFRFVALADAADDEQVGFVVEVVLLDPAWFPVPPAVGDTIDDCLGKPGLRMTTRETLIDRTGNERGRRQTGGSKRPAARIMR